MEFKRVQHKDSRQIIAYCVDGKKVNRLEFEHLESKCINDGKKYNSSSIQRKNSRCNFNLIHHYN